MKKYIAPTIAVVAALPSSALLDGSDLGVNNTVNTGPQLSPRRNNSPWDDDDDL